MKNMMHYKGYMGSVEYSEEDNCLFGKVQGIRSLVSYEGVSTKDLLNDFHEAVDDYLALCEEMGDKPERPFKGSFNIRIDSDLHRDAWLYAKEHGITLNKFVEEAIEHRLASK